MTTLAERNGARSVLREETGCSHAEARALVPEPDEPAHAMLAAMAMQGLITGHAADDIPGSPRALAEEAHTYADAMIEMREARRKP